MNGTAFLRESYFASAVGFMQTPWPSYVGVSLYIVSVLYHTGNVYFPFGSFFSPARHYNNGDFATETLDDMETSINSLEVHTKHILKDTFLALRAKNPSKKLSCV